MSSFSCASIQPPVYDNVHDYVDVHVHVYARSARVVQVSLRRPSSVLVVVGEIEKEKPRQKIDELEGPQDDLPSNAYEAYTHLHVEEVVPLGVSRLGEDEHVVLPFLPRGVLQGLARAFLEKGELRVGGAEDVATGPFGRRFFIQAGAPPLR